MAVTFVVSEVDLGTPESRWSALHLERLPALELGPPGRAVVVAPHPDDEVLGVGGTMRLLDGLGWSVEVVAVTDGEGSHPHRRPAAVAAQRRAEVDDALDRLGLGGVPVHRLGLADGGGTGAWGGRLTEALGEVLPQADVCLAPWRSDGHPDHEAAGQAAATAGARFGVRLVEYPVWAWHWDDPASSVLPLATARRVGLDAGTHAARVEAIRAFGSQTDLLPEPVLDRFRRPFEVLLP